jgi:hypothetical protein
VYHTSCAVQYILQASTDTSYKQQTLALLEGLAPNKHPGIHGVRSEDNIATAKSQMLSQLAALLKEGDPLNSESIVHLIGVPFAGSGADMGGKDWQIGSEGVLSVTTR